MVLANRIVDADPLEVPDRGFDIHRIAAIRNRGIFLAFHRTGKIVLVLKVPVRTEKGS